MDKDFRFYLNDVELENDILNFSDIEFVTVRSSVYWGYYRKASIDSLTFIKNDALKVKAIFDNGNFNTDAVFRIDTINRKFGTYETFQSGVLTFESYSEELNENNVFKVSVGFSNSSEQEKLEGRGNNDLIIGNNKSVEGEDLISSDLIDVTYNRKVFKNQALFTFSSELQKTDFYQGSDTTLTYYYDGSNNSSTYTGDITIDGTQRAYGSTNARRLYGGTLDYGSPEVAFYGHVPFNYVHLGLLKTDSNTDNANSSYATNYNDYQSYVNLNSQQVVQITDNSYRPTDGNMFFTPSLLDREINLQGNIKLEVTWRHREFNSDVRVGVLIELCQFSKSDQNLSYYDIEEVITQDTFYHFLNENGILDTSLSDDLPDKISVQNLVLPVNLLIDLPEGSALGYRTSRYLDSSTNPSYRDIVMLFEDDETDLELFYYDNEEEYPTTTHKSQMVYEVLDSLISQITDKDNVLISNYFGRTDNGYDVDGEGSLLAFTNGFLLRNATNLDGSEVDLVLTFKNVFQTLTALKGVGIFWDGVNIHIERRVEMFGNEMVELSPESIKTSIATELIYTSVEVGNNKVEYEDVNGTNEFNALFNFNTPIRVEENVLDLVTVYNTDYTGIERARRLSFQNSFSVDSIYDELVFLAVVKRDGVGGFETVIGYDGYVTIRGVILPEYAGNLDLSPKRMLLNNSDLIGTSFWKNNSDLTFVKSDTLSDLESKKTFGDLVIEKTDLTNSEMNNVKVIPYLYELTIGKKDILKSLNNPSNYYNFTYNNVEKYCELWDVSIKDNKGTITLIEKA